ncbi:uncharacterized protein METZ01_LOCUS274361, partial [marine metagenome]
ICWAEESDEPMSTPDNNCLKNNGFSSATSPLPSIFLKKDF